MFEAKARQGGDAEEDHRGDPRALQGGEPGVQRQGHHPPGHGQLARLLGEHAHEGDRLRDVPLQVVIGENSGQGIRVASKCLWDTSSDNWASFSYKTPSLFAVAMVFGLYYE